MKIVIYGGGCSSCKALYNNTQKAVQSVGNNATIEYITDMRVIATNGFMTLPVLEIDGMVVSKGKVLNSSEITKLL
ncbi:MAG: MTH895/ArsE family thioredoxin-like protein [Clostridia bacterium]